MKVYIVEDSPMIRNKTITMLSAIKGVEIAGVSDGSEEALKEILKCNPDIVILDIRLKGGSGIDLLETVKERYPEIMVVMFTNYNYPQYLKRCRELGADYFFDKSKDFDQVYNVVLEKCSSNLGGAFKEK